jgi:hypothetical protein
LRLLYAQTILFLSIFPRKQMYPHENVYMNAIHKIKKPANNTNTCKLIYGYMRWNTVQS